MECPVIFIHYGHNFYIRKNMQICAKNNNNIIFLGDDENKNLVKDIKNLKFYYFDDFRNDDNLKFIGKAFIEFMKTQSSREFLKLNSYRIFCLEKWMILRNFLQTQNYKHVFIFDTDNIILCNLSNFIKQYNKYDFIRYYNTGFQSYIKTDIINEFYKFLIDVRFAYEENIMSLTDNFITKKDYNYLVGDVDALDNTIYDKAISSDMLNLYEETTDQIYIKNMSYSTQPIKNIYYDSNKNLYFKRIEDDKFLQLNTLNMSWVLESYYNEVSNFILEDKKTINVKNFYKITNEV